MAETIIDSGTARNIAGIPTRDGVIPNPDERKYVTYVNDLGAVHTIIVDVEHAAKDASQLLDWFRHTRAVAAVSAGDPSADGFIPPAEVAKRADAAAGITQPSSEAQATGADAQGQGGGY